MTFSPDPSAPLNALSSARLRVAEIRERTVRSTAAARIVAKLATKSRFELACRR